MGLHPPSGAYPARDGHGAAPAAGDVDLELPVLDRLTVDVGGPVQTQVGGRGEHPPVGQPDPAPTPVLGHHRTPRPQELPETRVGTQVRADQAVDAEVAVVDLLAEVAAVGPEGPPVTVGLGESLVPPVPHEATPERRVGVERVHVLVQRPVRVAHRVAVLAQDQRPVVEARLLGPPRPRHDVVDRGVHRAHDVGHQPLRARRRLPVRTDDPLVVHEPGGIDRADPGRRGVERGTVPRLVAERPADHARMVAVAQHHAPGPLDDGGVVAGVVRQRTETAVGLAVGLVHDVEAELVAEVVAAGGRWGSGRCGRR